MPRRSRHGQAQKTHARAQAALPLRRAAWRRACCAGPPAAPSPAPCTAPALRDPPHCRRRPRPRRSCPRRRCTRRLTQSRCAPAAVPREGPASAELQWMHERTDAMHGHERGTRLGHDKDALALGLHLRAVARQREDGARGSLARLHANACQRQLRRAGRRASSILRSTSSPSTILPNTQYCAAQRLALENARKPSTRARCADALCRPGAARCRAGWRTS
jgi:hypothetical protein